MAAERRVNPGDLVTDRWGAGIVLHQNMYKPGSRSMWLNNSEVALVTWVGRARAPISGVNRDVCDVLFKGEVWRANTIGLRVVKDD